MTRSDCYELGRAPMFACAALASALLGCSAQVDGEYQGEPLATIRGTVTSTRGALEADQPVVAAVLWYVQTPADQIEPKFVGDRVSVRGSFPANFTLDIFNPPPKVAEMTMNYDFEQMGISLPIGTPLGIWTGFVVALDPRAKDDDIKAEDILGIDISHTLIYLEDSGATWDGTSPIDRDTVLRMMRHQLLLTYNIEQTTGFHLAKHNPIQQLGLNKIRECAWAETCVHWIGSDQQEFYDWEFQRCTERFPQNPTCSAHSAPVPDEPAPSSACRGQIEARAATIEACIDDATDWLNEQTSDFYLQSPAGLADPITIEMGTHLWDRSG